jgi:hypothetical protein
MDIDPPLVHDDEGTGYTKSFLEDKMAALSEDEQDIVLVQALTQNGNNMAVADSAEFAERLHVDPLTVTYAKNQLDGILLGHLVAIDPDGIEGIDQLHLRAWARKLGRSRFCDSKGRLSVERTLLWFKILQDDINDLPSPHDRRRAYEQFFAGLFEHDYTLEQFQAILLAIEEHQRDKNAVAEECMRGMILALVTSESVELSKAAKSELTRGLVMTVMERFEKLLGGQPIEATHWEGVMFRTLSKAAKHLPLNFVVFDAFCRCLLVVYRAVDETRMTLHNNFATLVLHADVTDAAKAIMRTLLAEANMPLPGEYVEDDTLPMVPPYDNDEEQQQPWEPEQPPPTRVVDNPLQPLIDMILPFTIGPNAWNMLRGEEREVVIPRPEQELTQAAIDNINEALFSYNDERNRDDWSEVIMAAFMTFNFALFDSIVSYATQVVSANQDMSDYNYGFNPVLNLDMFTRWLDLYPLAHAKKNAFSFLPRNVYQRIATFLDVCITPDISIDQQLFLFIIGSTNAARAYYGKTYGPTGLDDLFAMGFMFEAATKMTYARLSDALIELHHFPTYHLTEIDIAAICEQFDDWTRKHKHRIREPADKNREVEVAKFLSTMSSVELRNSVLGPNNAFINRLFKALSDMQEWVRGLYSTEFTMKGLGSFLDVRYYENIRTYHEAEKLVNAANMSPELPMTIHSPESIITVKQINYPSFYQRHGLGKACLRNLEQEVTRNARGMLGFVMMEYVHAPALDLVDGRYGWQPFYGHLAKALPKFFTPVNTQTKGRINLYDYYPVVLDSSVEQPEHYVWASPIVRRRHNIERIKARGEPKSESVEHSERGRRKSDVEKMPTTSLDELARLVANDLNQWIAEPEPELAGKKLVINETTPGYHIHIGFRLEYVQKDANAVISSREQDLIWLGNTDPRIMCLVVDTFEINRVGVVLNPDAKWSHEITLHFFSMLDFLVALCRVWARPFVLRGPELLKSIATQFGDQSVPEALKNMWRRFGDTAERPWPVFTRIASDPEEAYEWIPHARVRSIVRNKALQTLQPDSIAYFEKQEELEQNSKTSGYIKSAAEDEKGNKKKDAALCNVVVWCDGNGKMIMPNFDDEIPESRRPKRRK